MTRLLGGLWSGWWESRRIEENNSKEKKRKTEDVLSRYITIIGTGVKNNKPMKRILYFIYPLTALINLLTSHTPDLTYPPPPTLPVYLHRSKQVAGNPDYPSLSLPFAH